MQWKNAFAISGIVSLLIGFSPALALSKTRPTWQLPDSAVQVDDHTYYLGTKHDPKSGKIVEGYAFLKFQNENARGGNNARKPGGLVCYAFLASGAKWKGTAEPWIMNTANARGLTGATVFSIESNGIAKWEDATDGNTSNAIGVNVMANGATTGVDLSVDAGTLNAVNEVYFADITGSSSTIAVTTVWGIFGGPVSGRELVEWDQVYDDVSFDWSTTGAGGKMDFDNIATHELGHAFGMGHPKSTCTQETMYAYANNGETLKRDLNTGDIAGINLLY